MKPVKKIALLHDLCGVGKAALTNMIPVLSVMGVEACPVPTVLLSTHTGGYGTPAVLHTSGDYIRSCARHYRAEGVCFDMIFVGYMGSSDTVNAVLDFIMMFPETPVILDPIMGDYGKYYGNLDNCYGQAVERLLPYTEFILPNLTECYLLLQEPCEQPDIPKDYHSEEIENICRRLQKKGAKNIIITSVPIKDSPKGIVLYQNNVLQYQTNREVLTDYHGTGDVFDGVFIAGLLNGNSISKSISDAHQFVCSCIEESSKYDYPKREGLMIEKSLDNLYK